jgi:endonuclease/exonuclease/phosphatase family metal-dependent hydrolase
LFKTKDTKTMGSFGSKQDTFLSLDPPLPTTALTVVTYNTFLRPHIVQNDAQQQRAQLIPGVLAQFQADILCLQECWSKFAIHQLLKGLSNLGYQYIVQTKQVTSLKVLHAGLVTCSKFPIIKTLFVPFDTCSGTDCLATKGFLYSQVAHPILGTVHVFNIHLQFVTATRLKSSDFKKLRVQDDQLQKWYHFVQSLALPQTDIVLLAGDWNFDCVNNENEFQALLQKLRVQLPQRVGAQTVSVDPSQNCLVGRGNEARKYGCVDVLYTGQTCECCPSRWVDFVVYSILGRQPLQSFSKIMPVSVPAFSTRWMEGCTQLSDHYPVLSTLQF